MRAYELEEAMIWSKPGMAAVIPVPEIDTIVLFNASDDMKMAIENHDYDMMEANIFGSIKLYPLKPGGKDYGVGEVGAEKGYGPLLYYLAMAKYGWLAPHYNGVSIHAKKVWKNFWDNKHIKRKGILNDHPEEYLSRAYALDNTTQNKALQTLRHLLEMGDVFINRFDGKLPRKQILGHIDDAADDARRAKLGYSDADI